MQRRVRHGLARRLARLTAAMLITVMLLAVGWLGWVFLFAPSPPGFAPTSGQAAPAVDASPGIRQYTIDARERRAWVYFSFSAGSGIATSQEGLDWDLAFRRTDILTNGGETNVAGRGGAADLGDGTLDTASAPLDGYREDATHEERGLENPVLHKWYSYDWITHTVSSRHHLYAVKTHAGEAALVEFLSYYCSDGSAGCVTFRYLYPAPD